MDASPAKKCLKKNTAALPMAGEGAGVRGQFGGPSSLTRPSATLSHPPEQMGGQAKGRGNSE